MERRTWFVCPHIGVRFVRLGLPSGMSGWVAAAGLVVGLVTPHSAVAQASPDLESGSRAEWAVEKLIGFGLIDDGMFVVRPRSQREAVRLLDQAQANLSRLDDEDRDAAERVLSSLSEDRLARRFNMDVRGDATVLDSPWLPVPEDTGADRIDAEVNHLVRYRGGRKFVDGQTAAAEIEIEAVAGKHVSVQATPRIWIGNETDDMDAHAQLIKGQARFQFGELQIDVGRHRSIWGPGRDGGTLLADNARGLDGVRISNDFPIRLPGFLSVLGPTQAELLLSRLESDRDVPHSNLVGYTVSILPYKLVEASFSALIHSGGDGAPETSFGERLADHVVFLDWFLKSDFLISNKAAALALGVRIPGLRHTRVFGEFTVEDPASSLVRLFWQDSAWLVGFRVPRLDRYGVLSLRAEYHHGGVRLHRHGQFTSGRTLHRLMVGMGGPDTHGGFVEIAVDKPRARFSLEVGGENRSKDRWRTRNTPTGDIIEWEKVEDLPDELSIRGVGTLSTVSRDGPEFTLRLGLERVHDSRFEDGATRHNAILQVAATVPIRSLPFGRFDE